MNALRRVSAAWRWVVTIWISEMLLAAVAAYGIRSHVAALMGDFVIPDHHLIYATAELVNADAGLVVSMVISLLTSTLLGWICWTALAPLVLLRLAGTEGAAALGQAWLQRLGPAIATSAWHLAIRIGLVFLAAQAIAALPSLAVAIVLLVVVPITTCALDLSRVAVVLEGARGGAVRTALDGYVGLIRSPRRTAGMITLAALQWLVVFAGVVAVVRTAGAALPVMRAAGAAAAFFGMWRLALAAGGARVSERA